MDEVSGRSDSIRSVRSVYESDTHYKTATICAEAERLSPEYAYRLLYEKLELVGRHLQPGRMLDLCCATGGHLSVFAPRVEQAIGLDFSARFITKAQELAAANGLGNARFIVGDAAAIPLRDNTVSTLYSLSSLYHVPNFPSVLSEVARVLTPGGKCVLDLGNSRSINAVCIKYYPELPTCHHISVPEMRSLISSAGLRIVEHRAFQLLPLWTDRPAWLWPLLHPRWKTIMRTRIGGRMLDEWVSNLPGLKSFAFRHLMVAQKPDAR